jgi:hypothetical protein
MHFIRRAQSQNARALGNSKETTYTYMHTLPLPVAVFCSVFKSISQEHGILQPAIVGSSNAYDLRPSGYVRPSGCSFRSL